MIRGFSSSESKLNQFHYSGNVPAFIDVELGLLETLEQPSRVGLSWRSNAGASRKGLQRSAMGRIVKLCLEKEGIPYSVTTLKLQSNYLPIT